MLPESLPGSIREIIRGILHYLVQHPHAADTLDGIVQWWLPRELRTASRTDVERGLAWLLAQQLIGKTCRPGVPPYYRLNLHKRHDATALLRALESAC